MNSMAGHRLALMIINVCPLDGSYHDSKIPFLLALVVRSSM